MAGIPSMKQMEPRIQDALYYQKLQPALRAYLKKLSGRGLHRHPFRLRRFRRQSEPDKPV